MKKIILILFIAFLFVNCKKEIQPLISQINGDTVWCASCNQITTNNFTGNIVDSSAYTIFCGSYLDSIETVEPWINQQNNTTTKWCCWSKFIQ